MTRISSVNFGGSPSAADFPARVTPPVPPFLLKQAFQRQLFIMSLAENQAIPLCSGSGLRRSEAAHVQRVPIGQVLFSRVRVCFLGQQLGSWSVCSLEQLACQRPVSFNTLLACQVLLPGLPNRSLDGAQAAMQGGRRGSASCWSGCRGGSAGGCRGPQGE